jgi:hypothetical protein
MYSSATNLIATAKRFRAPRDRYRLGADIN